MRVVNFISIVFLFFLTQSTLSGQGFYPKPDHPEWFKAVPKINDLTPEWAKVMYLEDTNYLKVDSLKNKYYAHHTFQKNIHTQNYKYWLKQVKNYIDDNGLIDYPEPWYEFQNYERKKVKRANRQNGNWSCIGPEITYINNGTLNTRPTQANVYCIGIAPSNTNVLYAGMETGGVFKTTDKGLNWSPTTYDYAIGSIHDIKIDPFNEDIVYICENTNLYKTTDGGTTWNLENTFSGKIEQLLIHSTVTDTIYAATADGLYKSENAGSTWTIKNAGRYYDIEAKPETNDTLYAAVENTTLIRPEILISEDSGNTWKVSDNGYYVPSTPAESTVYGCKIGVTPADPDRIYAAIIANGKDGDNGWIGIYYSLDKGGKWQEDSGFDGAPYESGNDPATNWYVAGYSSGYHQGFYNFDIDVSHSDPDKLWLGTIWFCESDNKGGNFEYIRGTRSLEMHADIQDIDVVGNDIWITSDGGINYSNDECQTVEVRMNGITASDFWGFGQGWNVDTWVGGRYHNGDMVYHENYNDGESLFLGGAESATGYVDQFNNLKSYFSDIGGRLSPTVLTETAKSISSLGQYPTQSYYDFSYSEVEWHPYYANQVYIGKEQYFLKSRDGGSSFDTLYTFPGDIRRYEISRDDPDVIYAIIYHSYWDWRVHKSADGGNTFSQITTPPYTSGSWRNLSLTLNPFDKDEIWLASNSSNNGNKIFSSTDGGSTWQNRYSNVIENESIKDVIYHASDQGDIVYTMTNDDFYYYDKTTSTWTNFSSGLPAKHGGFKILPFYRDQKIRLASSKGIWEAEMINSNKLQAIPMVTSDSVFCERDTLQFESYSINQNTGMSWSWSIDPTPLWINDPNLRNPRVLLSQNTSYDISLSISNGTHTDTRLLQDLITLDNQCKADTIPGKLLQTYDNGDYMVAQDANLSNLTHFTVTGWWKPNGSQQGFAALFSSGDWCAHCDYTEGLIVDYWGSKLWYKWPGNASNWGSNSGMTIPLDEWSYVALVIEPTQATLYLNEQKYVHSKTLSSGEFSDIYIGYGHYSKSFKGDIDEVTLWKRALTEQEIRSLRHLTKENEIESDPDLIAYYQFNKLVNENFIMDHAGSNHGVLNNDAIISTSNAPIGTGLSETFTINGPQSIQSITGIDINFSPGGTYPDGDIVISRINLQPDVSPTIYPIAKSYWVINNYGANNSFNSIKEISFSDIGIVTPGSSPVNYKLYDRSQNGFDNTWVELYSGDIIDQSIGSVGFNSSINISTLGQYTINNEGAKGWIGPVSSDWNNPANWGDNIVPSAGDDVIIPAHKPYDPIVNINAIIKSLILLPGASIEVDTNKTFEIKN